MEPDRSVRGFLGRDAVTTEEKQTLASAIARVLRDDRLGRRARTLLHDELARLGAIRLTPAQVRALHVLADGEEHPIGNITSYSVNYKSTMMLRGLGLARVRYDEDEAFIAGVRITTLGRHALEVLS